MEAGPDSSLKSDIGSAPPTNETTSRTKNFWSNQQAPCLPLEQHARIVTRANVRNRNNFVQEQAGSKFKIFSSVSLCSLQQTPNCLAPGFIDKRNDSGI
jgi:hypothetical protein